MNKYQKINTLYKRDLRGKIILGEYSIPEIEYLKDTKWECTEKIDGTNISLVWDGQLTFHGRTKDAETPKHLLEFLHKKYNGEIFKKIFPKAEKVEIYGEGYGVNIHGGGSYLPSSVDFIIFDVTIDGWKLLRENCEDIARKLKTDIVKLLGYYTIQEAEEIVIKGFPSNINHKRIAEGMVLKTPLGLCDRKGTRIATKIKHKDYK